MLGKASPNLQMSYRKLNLYGHNSKGLKSLKEPKRSKRTLKNLTGRMLKDSKRPKRSKKGPQKDLKSVNRLKTTLKLIKWHKTTI